MLVILQNSLRILLFLFISFSSVIAQEHYLFFAENQTKDGKYEDYVLNESGDKVLDKSYNSSYLNEWKWIIVFEEGSHSVFLPKDYKKVITEIDEIPALWSASTQLFPMKKKDKWGFYNQAGDVIIAHKYDDVTYFVNDRAAVKEGDATYYINAKGEKLDMDYERNKSYDFGAVHMGFASELSLNDYYKSQYDRKEKPDLVTNEKNKKGLQDSESKQIIIPIRYDRIVQMGNILDYFIVIKDNKWGIYSAEGKEIIPTIYDRVYIEKI